MNEKESIILEYINMNKMVSVDELSRKLHMSLSTVRRNLARLAARNLIMRYHGGASSINNGQIANSLASRYEKNRDKKERIAQKAAEQVKNGDTIIMLGGTTVSYMCKYLKRKKLSVITNSLIVVDMLKKENDIELIILGGIYNVDEAEVKGFLTNYSLQHLGADLLFASSTAFDINRGFLTSHVDSINLYTQCLKIAGKKYMLVDSSKYGKFDVAVTAKLTDVDYIITDSGLRNEVVEWLQEEGVQVILAK